MSSRSPSPSPPSSPSAGPTILSISFNQDATCFAVATTTGFLIFNSSPLRFIFRRDFTSSGGIGLIQMLFRCNILALVGGGPVPHYPPSSLLLWDDHTSRSIGELSFRSPVLSVRLRRDRVVVVLIQKVFVYNFDDLRLIHQIETVSNPRGLCEVSSEGGRECVVVCLGLQKGQIRVERYAEKKTKFVMAHEGRIAGIGMTRDGRFVATASGKGTLVRVWNGIDGTLLQEFRRGTDRADIHCLSFSPNALWLAVSSDRGTVHVFGMKMELASPGSNVLPAGTTSHNSPQSPKSSLSVIKGVLPLPRYFNSEWSVAKFHLQEGSRYIVAFGHEENTIVILGMDGSYHLCKFDPVTGGEMTLLEHHNILKQEQLSLS